MTVYDGSPGRTWRDAAAAANAACGLLRDHPELSDTDIAEASGVDPDTVAYWRERPGKFGMAGWSEWCDISIPPETP